ncbi:MAG: hypothetical protein NUV72_08775, partial [Bauldia sp.]|nr:hypothetical protein [Bauldia sp.]
MGRISRRAAIAGLVALPFVYLGRRRAAAPSADPPGDKTCIPPSATVGEVTEASDLPGLMRGGFIDDV